MFWIIYFVSSVMASLLIAKMSKEYGLELFIFFLVIFLTPAQTDPSISEYSPSVFSYIFNVLFEQNFSTRVLRPLFIFVPLGILLTLLVLFIKKRFF